MGNESANYVVFDPGVSATVVLNSYIGGVGSFFGPALGAALMSFFGHAVSDTTQSWLLYQGVTVRAGDDVHARRADRAGNRGGAAGRAATGSLALLPLALERDPRGGYCWRAASSSWSRCCRGCSRRTTARRPG